MKEKKQNILRRVVGALVFTSVVILIIVIMALWLNGGEVYISETDRIEPSSYLICSAKSMKESFFDFNDETDVNYKIKVIFGGDRADAAVFTAYADFTSRVEAEQIKSSMQAKYNIYMAEKAESLTPTFNLMDKRMVINLYANRGWIDALTAPLFFLKTSEALGFYGLSGEEVAKLYRAKGMECTLENNN